MIALSPATSSRAGWQSSYDAVQRCLPALAVQEADQVYIARRCGSSLALTCDDQAVIGQANCAVGVGEGGRSVAELTPELGLALRALGRHVE